MKSIFQRALTPALTLLIAALGMVTASSLSKTQRTVQAFTCGETCTTGGNAFCIQQGGLSCGLCNHNFNPWHCTHS
jgi:hypothetical protein